MAFFSNYFSEKQTITAGIRLLNDSYGGYYERVLAACMLAMIPTLIVYIFAKIFYAGVTFGFCNKRIITKEKIYGLNTCK